MKILIDKHKNKKINPIGVSVIGPEHIKNNISNQDSFSIVKNDNYTLLVISDGMGSKKYADIGSKKACYAVRKAICNYMKLKQKSMSFSLLFKNIINIWENSLLPYLAKDCSSTCLFSFITKDKILLARLGDGMICLLGKNKQDDLLITDEKKEEFINSSNSLSDTLAYQEFEYKVVDREKIKAILITTDGISSDLKENSHIPFSRDLIKSLKTQNIFNRKKSLIKMLKEWPVAHHTDDKTIVVMEL